MTVVEQEKPSQEKSSSTDEMKMRSYLRSKNINPKGNNQLALLFEDMMPDDARSIPNEYARSALFTTTSKKAIRKEFKGEQIFHMHETIKVFYRGEELRAADDELVFLQLLHYAKHVPLGDVFEFTLGDLLTNLGWAKTGAYYEKARECISRMKASEVRVSNERAYGKGVSLSLIAQYETEADGEGKASRYRMIIDSRMILLFAGGTFTNHDWEKYRSLSPMARRMADYIGSHKEPFPLAIEKFKGMCGSDNLTSRSWRQKVKQACDEIAENAFAKTSFIKGDMIYFQKAK